MAAMMAIFPHLQSAHEEVLLGHLIRVKNRHHLRHICSIDWVLMHAQIQVCEKTNTGNAAATRATTAGLTGVWFVPRNRLAEGITHTLAEHKSEPCEGLGEALESPASSSGIGTPGG